MKNQNMIIGCFAASLLATTALAQPPKIHPEGSWITLSGTVMNPKDDSFTLDYGQGRVSVEVQDWDWYHESLPNLAGEKVTVYGEVDQHLFARATIDADSIYFEGLGTYFFATPPADVTFTVMDVSPVTPILIGYVSFTGTVNKVEGREFTLNTGSRELTVDTSSMANNPLDDQGQPRVGKGDIVSVAGDLDTDLIRDRRFNADTLVVIRDKSK